MELENQYLKQWQAQAKDYPSQALLQVGFDILREQEERLARLQQELDGRMWSPKEW